MYTLVLIIGLFLGFVVGFIFGVWKSKETPVGVLRVDRSDPDDGPYLFLEMNTTPEVITKRKYITLEVLAKNYISQK